MCLDENIRKKYIQALQGNINEKRFQHTLGVEKMAVKLAKMYGADVRKAQTAALFHDMAKRLDNKLALAKELGIEPSPTERTNPKLLHGPIAAKLMERDFHIVDTDVLNAVRYHTTGRRGMSKLEKIIYQADFIEETRDFDGVDELRKRTFEDLDAGLLEGLIHTLKYLLDKRVTIEWNSIEAYNHMLSLKEERDGKEI